MSLSDRIWEADCVGGEYEPMPVISVNSVKEFIKKLKEKTKHLDYCENEGGINKTHKVIDELAGDKLI